MSFAEALIFAASLFSLLVGGYLIYTYFISSRLGSGLSGRLRTFVGERAETAPESPTTSFSDKLARTRARISAFFGILESERINEKLVSANWQISGSEFYMLQYGGALLGFFVGGLLIFRSPVAGIGLAILLFLLPGILLERSIRSRIKRFDDQLVDVLVLINGAVRSGYSLLQSLDVVIAEMPAPASEEFERVQIEVGLGIPLRTALTNMTIRMPSPDLKIVVTAVNINTQVGGNLSQMLEAVTDTIRDRIRILGEIRALTSYSRYTSYILSLLPFIVTAILFVLNPEYISRIFEPGPYLLIPIVALLMVIIGNIWIRILGRIEV